MAARGGSAAAGRQAQRRQASPKTPARMRGSAGGDILGLLIAVIAIAMMLALASPSDAPVTSAVGNFLKLCFGKGAFLFPASLLIFGITFFLDVDDPISGRVALGLALIVVSVLSLISLNVPGAEADPSIVVSMDRVSDLGGFVGGGVAWGLLVLVGVGVGDVILGGIIAVGIVICGFSISGMVTRMRRGAMDARESLRGAHEQHRAARELRANERRARMEEAQSRKMMERPRNMRREEPEPMPYVEPATSFLGSRKSSVLTRQNSSTFQVPEPFDNEAQVADAETKILRGRSPKSTKSVKSTKSAKSTSCTREQTQAREQDAWEARFEDQPTRRTFAEAVQEELPGLRESFVYAEAEGLPWDDPAVETVDTARLKDEPKRSAKSQQAEEFEHVEEVAEVEEVVEGEDPEPNVPAFLQQGRRGRVSTRTDNGAQADAMCSSTRHKGDATVGASTQSKAAKPARKPAAAKKKAAVKEATSVAAAGRVARPGEGDEGYELPSFGMLSSNPNSAQSASSVAELDETKARLQSTLAEFGLTSRVVDYTSGPLVTTFQVEMGEGERVNRITNLQDDIALSLAAKSVRIFAPIPGTSRVGIEIPNKTRQNVYLGDVLPHAEGGPLEFAIGRDAEGRPVTADLAAMPHLLVAGATGSGKSVVINSLIMSLLMRSTPKQVRLILVDPKRVEFSCYNGLPHLYVPVVTDPRQAASALQWAVSEMERRLKVFERAGARNINIYNEMCVSGKLAEMDNPPDPMPFMAIIIDELADLMMVAGKDVEASIVRIAQLARAAGIHLVLATQRPSANVVTGLIKSNIETRIALSVASGTDSRVIIDQVGAQRLLGRGDMLFKERGGSPRRALGCFVSDPEIESVVDFIRDQAEPDYHEEILSAVAPGQPGGGSFGGSDLAEDDDPLVWEAAQIVVESQLGSTSGLQRRLKVGYARAGRIMDNLESKGVVGPPDGSKPREVLLDLEGLEELRTLEAAYREV